MFHFLRMRSEETFTSFLISTPPLATSSLLHPGLPIGQHDNMQMQLMRVAGAASSRLRVPRASSTALAHCRSLCSSQSSEAATKPPTIVVEAAEGTPVDEPKKVEEETSMKPREIVEQLDRYIVGQPDAKRAVAVAMRNRWRRQRVASPLKEDIMPKNILMIGPTGVGKTEIARRLAKLARAPFVKVEATKFTEVSVVLLLCPRSCLWRCVLWCTSRV